MKYPKEFEDLRRFFYRETMEAYGAQIAWRALKVNE